jgi:5-methylcytosine-specific restriction endonuclease McrA
MTCGEECSLALHLRNSRARARAWQLANHDRVCLSRRKRYAEHPGRRIYNREYRATYPGRVLAYSRKWRQEHPEQGNACTRKWQAEHREQAHETARKYRATDRGRAGKAANKLMRRISLNGPAITADSILELKSEYAGFCPYCNRPISDGHMDHIVSVSKGGTNERNNLVWVCAQCNRTKNDKSLLRFLLSLSVRQEYP